MKVFEEAANTLNEEVEVFEFHESGARGPAGTISSLNILDGKAVVVAADLTITGDSADSFTNKKSSYQQIIDSVLTTAFDLIYQPLSTALSKITESGGLPLWDGAAWPGGGGGGTWELVESRAMTFNLSELFTVGTDDVIKVEFKKVGMFSTSGGPIRLSLSIDSGVSYPSTINMAGNYNRDNSTTTTGHPAALTATADLTNLTTSDPMDGELIIADITTAGETQIFKPWMTTNLGGTNLWRFVSNMVFNTSGVVNKIKITAVKQMNSGTIKIYKLVGPTP